MKEGRDAFVSSDDSNRLVVRSDSTDVRWDGLVNTPTYSTRVAVPSVNLSHLRLMKSGQTAVKSMKSTSTSPLRSGYEPLPTLSCTN